MPSNIAQSRVQVKFTIKQSVNYQQVHQIIRGMVAIGVEFHSIMMVQIQRWMQTRKLKWSIYVYVL